MNDYCWDLVVVENCFKVEIVVYDLCLRDHVFGGEDGSLVEVILAVLMTCMGIV